MVELTEDDIPEAVLSTSFEDHTLYQLIEETSVSHQVTGKLKHHLQENAYLRLWYEALLVTDPVETCVATYFDALHQLESDGKMCLNPSHTIHLSPSIFETASSRSNSNQSTSFVYSRTLQEL